MNIGMQSTNLGMQSNQPCMAYCRALTPNLLKGAINKKAALKKHMKEYFSKVDLSISLYHAKANSPVACKTHCDACCYFLVAVSPIEASYIWYGIKNQYPMAEVNQLKKALQEKIVIETDIQKKYPNQYGRQAVEYYNYNIPCVFLTEDRLCKIYEYRPLICRFHAVISPQEFCYEKNSNRVQVWQEKSLMEANVLFLKFLSTTVIKTDHMGSLVSQLLRFDN